jgi:broad specificity phosphatase PhoE
MALRSQWDARMTKILLVRHGHVEGIKPERFRGREPLELTAEGRAEAAAVARRIASFWRPSHMYTSPLGRCVQTAEAIGAACGLAAERCADLSDIDYGAWQFKTFADAKAENAELFAAWFTAPQFVRFPNGEALQDLAARTGNVLRFVLSRHSSDTIVLVAPDSTNRALLLQLLDLPLSSYWRIAQSPCCINEIDITGGKPCVLRLNEMYHLDAACLAKRDSSP